MSQYLKETLMIHAASKQMLMEWDCLIVSSPISLMNADKGQTWPDLSFSCLPAAHTLSGKVHVVFRMFQGTLLPSSQADFHMHPLLLRLQGTRITFLWFCLMLFFMAALTMPVIILSWCFLFSNTVHSVYYLYLWSGQGHRVHPQ